MLNNIREGALLNKKKFVEAYSLLHPDAAETPSEHVTLLYKKYLNITLWFSHSNLTYASFLGQYSHNRYQEDGSVMNPHDKSEFWLFHDLPFLENFNEQAASLVLEKDDDSLSVNDYALLLYVKNLEEDMKAMFIGFPATVLRDIFSSVGKDNLANWMKDD
jgi:hypothetical protein